MSTVVSMVTPNGSDDGEQRRKLLADRLAEPEVTDSLLSLLDHADLLAVLVEGVDGILRRGDDLSATLTDALGEARATLAAPDNPLSAITADDLKQVARSLSTLATQGGPLLGALVDSGALNTATMGAAGRLSAALAAAENAYPRGIKVQRGWGVIKAFRDKDVRAGMSYLLEIARALGAGNGYAPPSSPTPHPNQGVH